MAYQSFEGEDGHSDSFGKLKALSLPDDMTGMSFLDLGCNEGFFCGQALKRGAADVVGIDYSEYAVGQARTRFPEATFHHSNWWDFSTDKKFDVIILTSAIHYEPNPLMLCRKIGSMLKEGGLFVLEGGVFMHNEMPIWIPVARHDGILKYPTYNLLRDHVLQDFATRYVGPSVDQSGDPVPRHVFHARRFASTVVLVAGAGGVGKSVFVNELQKGGAAAINIDLLLQQLVQYNLLPHGPLVNILNSGVDLSRLDLLYKRISEEKLEDEFAELLLLHVPKEIKVTFLDCYGFIFESIQRAVHSRFGASGIRTWVCHQPDMA